MPPAACGLCLLPCSTEAHCSASAGALSAGGARRLRAAALRGGGCALLCLLGGLAAWGWKAARGGRDGVAGAPAGALKVGAKERERKVSRLLTWPLIAGTNKWHQSRMVSF